MLEKLKTTVIVVLLVALSNIGLSYEIELKNGRIIKTKDYWEENGMIFYHKHGVVVSIDKLRVKEIKGHEKETKEISVNISKDQFSDDPKIAKLNKQINELDLSIKEWKYEKGQLEWEKKRYKDEMSGDRYIKNRNRLAVLERKIRASSQKLKRLKSNRESLINNLERRANQEFIKKMNE